MTDHGPSTPPEPTPSESQSCRLGVSRYDRVSGMVLALLIVLGVLVLVMFLLWVGNRVLVSDKTGKTEWVPVGEKDSDPWGPGKDIEPPPSEGTDQDQEQISKLLDSAADKVAGNAASIGDGLGDKSSDSDPKRKKASQNPRRWELRFAEGNTLDTYARQLDYFGIESGVLQPGNKVLYLSNFSKAAPTRREAGRDEEQRYRFTWTRGSLEKADRQLFARSGVKVAGDQVIYKFLPKRLEAELQEMEKERAEEKVVRSTVFGIKSVGNDYAFFVLRQSYR